MPSNFVDFVKICCRSGAGGAGAVHFHRDKNTAKGGPDGGDGGRGGHIILKGNKQLWTLLHLKYRKHVIAEPGQNGSGAMKTGHEGKDEILDVPIGTIAKDAETDEFLFEITEEGQEVILAGGGRGGKGNIFLNFPPSKLPGFVRLEERVSESGKFLNLK